MPIHLKYFCGDAAERTEAQARQRRNSDRDAGGNGRRRSGGHSAGNGNKSAGKKKAMNNTKLATEMKTVKKPVVAKATAKNVTIKKPLKNPGKDISKKSAKKPARTAEIDAKDTTPRVVSKRGAALKAASLISRSAADLNERRWRGSIPKPPISVTAFAIASASPS